MRLFRPRPAVTDEDRILGGMCASDHISAALTYALEKKARITRNDIDSFAAYLKRKLMSLADVCRLMDLGQTDKVDHPREFRREVVREAIIQLMAGSTDTRLVKTIWNTVSAEPYLTYLRGYDITSSWSDIQGNTISATFGWIRGEYHRCLHNLMHPNAPRLSRNDIIDYHIEVDDSQIGIVSIDTVVPKSYAAQQSTAEGLGNVFLGVNDAPQEGASNTR